MAENVIPPRHMILKRPIIKLKQLRKIIYIR